MEERRELVLTPSAGAAAYRGRRHAGSRWRGTVAQRHGDSGKREQRACTQSAAPPLANAALAEVTSRNYIFGIPDPDLPIHYTTFIGLRRRLRVVYSGASPMLKPLTA